jgi:hypothetical protein
MRDFAFLDVVLEMLHLRGLTPADLMIRQRQLVADATPAPVAAPALESIRESTQPEADIRAHVNQNPKSKSDSDSGFDSLGKPDELWIDLSPETVPEKWVRYIELWKTASTAAASQPAQRLWMDFRGFNRNTHGKSKIEWPALRAFLRKWFLKFGGTPEQAEGLSPRPAPALTPKAASAARSEPQSHVSDVEGEMRRALNHAPLTLLSGDEERARERIGAEVFEEKCRALVEQFAWSVERAKRAVYGWVVKEVGLA